MALFISFATLILTRCEVFGTTPPHERRNLLDV
jgi:hypothetical protein